MSPKQKRIHSLCLKTWISPDKQLLQSGKSSGKTGLLLRNPIKLRMSNKVIKFTQATGIVCKVNFTVILQNPTPTPKQKSIQTSKQKTPNLHK